ncbi:MAG TPA: hypothetical protein VIH74_08500, partial [Candidatus Acidoferrum sp.]
MSALSPSNSGWRTFWKDPRSGSALGSISARTWGDPDGFDRLRPSLLLIFWQATEAGHHDVGNFVSSLSLARAFGFCSHGRIFACGDGRIKSV